MLRLIAHNIGDEVLLQRDSVPESTHNTLNLQDRTGITSITLIDETYKSN